MALTMTDELEQDIRSVAANDACWAENDTADRFRIQSFIAELDATRERLAAAEREAANARHHLWVARLLEPRSDTPEARGMEGEGDAL